MLTGIFGIILAIIVLANGYGGAAAFFAVAILVVEALAFFLTFIRSVTR